MEEGDHGVADALGGTIGVSVAEYSFECFAVGLAGGRGDEVGREVLCEIIGCGAQHLLEALLGDEKVASAYFSGPFQVSFFVAIELFFVEGREEIVDDLAGPLIVVELIQCSP